LAFLRKELTFGIMGLLHILLGIIKHFGPIIPLVDGFVGEGSTSDMVFTVAIVDFLHHLLDFVRPEAPQIRVRVQLGVGLFVHDVSQDSVSSGHVLELLHFSLIAGSTPSFR